MTLGGTKSAGKGVGAYQGGSAIVPPSSTKIVPFTYSASSLSRKQARSPALATVPRGSQPGGRATYRRVEFVYQRDVRSQREDLDAPGRS